MSFKIFDEVVTFRKTSLGAVADIYLDDLEFIQGEVYTYFMRGSGSEWGVETDILSCNYIDSGQSTTFNNWFTVYFDESDSTHLTFTVLNQYFEDNGIDIYDFIDGEITLRIGRPVAPKLVRSPYYGPDLVEFTYAGVKWGADISTVVPYFGTDMDAVDLTVRFYADEEYTELVDTVDFVKTDSVRSGYSYYCNSTYDDYLYIDVLGFCSLHVTTSLPVDDEAEDPYADLPQFVEITYNGVASPPPTSRGWVDNWNSVDVFDISNAPGVIRKGYIGISPQDNPNRKIIVSSYTNDYTDKHFWAHLNTLRMDSEEIDIWGGLLEDGYNNSEFFYQDLILQNSYDLTDDELYNGEPWVFQLDYYDACTSIKYGDEVVVSTGPAAISDPAFLTTTLTNSKGVYVPQILAPSPDETYFLHWPTDVGDIGKEYYYGFQYAPDITLYGDSNINIAGTSLSTPSVNVSSSLTAVGSGDDMYLKAYSDISDRFLWSIANSGTQRQRNTSNPPPSTCVFYFYSPPDSGLPCFKLKMYQQRDYYGAGCSCSSLSVDSSDGTVLHTGDVAASAYATGYLIGEEVVS